MEGAAPPLLQRPQGDPFSPALVGCSASPSGACEHEQGCGGGEGCEMDRCEKCVAWRQHLYRCHPGTGATRQFIVRASDGFRDSVCLPQEAEHQLRNLIPDSESIKLEGPDGHVYNVKLIKFGWIYLSTGWPEFVDANHIQEGDYIGFVYGGSSSFKVHIFSPSGHDNSEPPADIFRAVPPCNHRHVLNEQVEPDPVHVETSDTEFDYTAFPGTSLTEAQDEKVVELAHGSMTSEIPLHVAALSKENGNEDCYVCIPLRLLENFKEGMTIQLKAHGNKMIYSVCASKHGDDQIILQSGLSIFVASHRIQKNVDILVFRSKGKARLEVLALDPSGCERTPCSAMGNSSNAREMREDSVEIIDKKPPPQPTVVDVSSDDDEIVGKDTPTSRREQRLVRGRHAKARKMASTSSPCTNSEHKAGNSNEEASLEGPVPNNKLKKPYILPKWVTLTGQQEEKAKEKVRAIGSKFPVFVKVMMAHPSLEFCLEFASACLPATETPLVLRLEGSKTTWPTMLLVKKTNNARWTYKGWMNLVSQAGIEKGDICLIELTDKSSESLAMRVHLIRKSEMQL